MKKAALIICAVAAFLFIKSYDKEVVKITKDTVILAFGDSLTQGYGARERESYPAKLSEILGVRVINGGVSGEVTFEALSRLPQVLSQHKPQVVILCHGGNDILRKTDPKTTKQNLAAMIDLINKNGAKIILVGVLTFQGFGINTASFYDELADEYDLAYDGKTIAKIIKTPSLKSDQIHPNKEGYLLLAQNIAKLFKKID